MSRSKNKECPLQRRSLSCFVQATSAHPVVSKVRAPLQAPADVFTVRSAPLPPPSWLPFTASAQTVTTPVSSTPRILPTIVVTATRVPSPDFDVPAAIGVIDSDE